MPNPFYTKLFNAAPRTTASSSAVNQEFAALQTAFNTLSDTPIFAGPVRLTAGSAAAPAVTTAGDLDTGIYFPSANALALVVGGIVAAVVDSARRLLVGLASSAPQVTSTGTVSLMQPRLQVGGTSREQATIGIHGFGGTATPTLVLAASGSGTAGAVDVAASGAIGVVSFNASTGAGYAEVGRISCQSDGARGATLPTKLSFTVWNSTGSEKTGLTLDSTGAAILGSAVVAASTEGFVHIPASNGAPTGVPVLYSGKVPMYVDTTNFRFYVYVGGSWRYAALV